MQTHTVGILLYPQFSNHCLANAVEPMRALNTLARKQLFQWRFLTPDGRSVTSSSGLPVLPEAPLSQSHGGSHLMVVSSYGHTDLATPENLRALRQAARRYDVLVGMDTGSWLLASAGLLDGHRATIHWDLMDAFAETFPEVQVLEDRFVLDGNRASCGGAMTTFELVLEIIERMHGPVLRLEVANLFMHGERTDLTDRFSRATGSQVVDAAVALMRRNIERPLSVPTLARRAGVAQKRLEMLFSARLGMTPHAVYRQLRLNMARRLVEQTRLSVAEIAGRCGYDDPSALTRAFSQAFQQTPRTMRKHIAAAGRLDRSGDTGNDAGRTRRERSETCPQSPTRPGA